MLNATEFIQITIFSICSRLKRISDTEAQEKLLTSRVILLSSSSFTAGLESGSIADRPREPETRWRAGRPADVAARFELWRAARGRPAANGRAPR